MAKSKGSSTYNKAGGGAGKVAERYTHPDQTSPMRPDIGTQPQFRKKKPPKTYRYDSSLSPSLEWDGQNGSREIGEWLLGLIERGATLPKGTFETPQEFKAANGVVVLSIRTLAEAVHHLKRLSKPFLTWTGKAERLSFDVPTLPLFVHERLSTKAIVDTLVGHKTDKQTDMFTMFGDPQHSIVDQTLRASEHQDKWVNRMVLGDSLVVMNSLLQYEGLGGQVQMIKIHKRKDAKAGKDAKEQYQVELIGLDTFDPSTMAVDHRSGDDVPAWFVDTDYNNLCFHVSQGFFPRTGAWNDLRKSLKGDDDDSVWDHLAGTLSAPFEAGEQRRIAVKVIDDRGNELLVVKTLP